MAYKHGVYVKEQATALAAPLTGTAGLQVVVGTAPVNMLSNPADAVNKPLLVNTFAEACEAVGYSDNFAAYTLCQSIYAAFQVMHCGPLVLINVLDPKKHTADIEEATLQVNAGTAMLDVKGVLLDTLTVKTEETALTAGKDYLATFGEDGGVVIALMADGAAAAATTLTVTEKTLDATKVTAADIVGSVDAVTGAESGLEVVRQVYPRLGMTPGILLAPGWSKEPAVAAALQAKCGEINGVFRAVCVLDVDSSETGAARYTDVKEAKEAAGMSSANAFAVWPCVKLEDKVCSGSAAAAALMAHTDSVNGDVPNMSPDNKMIGMSAACLEDGTEVYLDQTQANELNGVGVATWLNMNGWRMWGNNTAAYPANTDPKDRWINTRRFMIWAANSFILTYFQKVGSVMNDRLIESIVDSENMRGNSFVSRGLCAGYEIEYREEDNPVTELMNGHIAFHMYVTPFTPAEHIEDTIEFDPNALQTALGL